MATKKKVRDLHVVRLECGHDTLGAPTAERKRCKICGVMRAVTAVGDLVAAAGSRPPVSTKVITRSDGLTVRHFENKPMKQWWCRFCDGKKAPKVRIGRADSIEDVFLQWDVHKTTGAHLHRLDSMDLEDDLIDAMASAHDRSSSGEQPPPPSPPG